MPCGSGAVAVRSPEEPRGAERNDITSSHLVAFLLLVVRMLLVVRPGAPSSILAPSSDALVTSSDALVTSSLFVIVMVSNLLAMAT